MSHRHLVKLFVFGATLPVFLYAAAAEPATSVIAVRYWSLTDVTRVAVETTGDFHFRSDRAHDPERVFVDLTGARLKIVKKGQYAVPVGDKLIKQIRVAETQPGTTRVVFDLDGNVEFTASQLSNPDRLIVEFRPGGIQMPAAPATMSVAGGQKLPMEEKPPLPLPRAPLPQPSVVPAPSIPPTGIAVASMYDPTRAREKAVATLNASVTPVTRNLDLPVPVAEKRRESPMPLVPLPAMVQPAGAAKAARLSKRRTVPHACSRIEGGTHRSRCRAWRT